VFSKPATAIDLPLFDHVDDAKPSRIIRVDAVGNRTYHYWHVFVPGLKGGQIPPSKSPAIVR
jgi:isoamylase